MTVMCHLHGTEYGEKCSGPASCFVRNQREWGKDGSFLKPVCPFHKGECVETVVPLEEGTAEFSVQEVMGA